MDYDEPLQNECSVSGLLSVVLHVSRVLGMAPLKFDRLHNGWRIRVSRIYSLCGQAVVIGLTILSMIVLFEDLKKNVKEPSRTIANAFTICLTVNVGAYIGLNRMQCLINCLSQLNQITEELNRYYQPTANDKQTWFTVVISLIFVSTIVIYGYFFYYMFLVRELILILYTSFEVLSIQLVMLVVQFSVISMSVVPALQQLNGCLCGVSLTRNKNARSSAVLHRLAFLYSSLCDIIRQLDYSNGSMLVVMLLTLMLQLMVTNYYVICGWLYPERFPSRIMVFTRCLKVLWHLGLLVLLVEPCHQTYNQIQHTKKLIQKMMLCISPGDLAIISNLNLFYQQLMLNQIVYTPMKLFILNRTLLITIISSMTTYLVILIQM